MAALLAKIMQRSTKSNLFHVKAYYFSLTAKVHTISVKGRAKMVLLNFMRVR